MKECDEKFKKGFGKLYEDIMEMYQELREYPAAFIVHKNFRINKFIDETDSLYSKVEDLTSFIEYIYRTYPSLREVDCVREHQVKCDFRKGVVLKIQELIDKRKESKEERVKNIKMLIEAGGIGWTRTVMENGEITESYISPGLIYKSHEQEDTYKPGDRVFFIRQHIEYNVGGNCSPTSQNTYIGVIKDWSVEEERGYRICKVERSFHVLNSWDGSIYSFDHENAFNSDEFAKALIHNSKDTINGQLQVYRVDEKHFPKLNSIVAKIAKPEPDDSPRISASMSFGYVFGRS